MRTAAIHIDSVNGILVFEQVQLVFTSLDNTHPIWSLKNNNTVIGNLSHLKYAKLVHACAPYENSLDMPLGKFLLSLKNSGDFLYLKFLNPDGDLEFSTFVISQSDRVSSRGLYPYRLYGQIVYIGRRLDSFRKRINDGYGRIHPKNCCIDDQRTNCRLNALISAHRDSMEFFICPMNDAAAIARLESELLSKHRPNWNMQFH
jgi:hypothetical protein